MKLRRLLFLLLASLLAHPCARADDGDVLERIIRLPAAKGTVYALLGKVSELSGYLFVYDSKVVNNDAQVRAKRMNCTVQVRPKFLGRLQHHPSGSRTEQHHRKGSVKDREN